MAVLVVALVSAAASSGPCDAEKRRHRAELAHARQVHAIALSARKEEHAREMAVLRAEIAALRAELAGLRAGATVPARNHTGGTAHGEPERVLLTQTADPPGASEVAICGYPCDQWVPWLQVIGYFCDTPFDVLRDAAESSGDCLGDGEPPAGHTAESTFAEICPAQADACPKPSRCDMNATDSHLLRQMISQATLEDRESLHILVEHADASCASCILETIEYVCGADCAREQYYIHKADRAIFSNFTHSLRTVVVKDGKVEVDRVRHPVKWIGAPSADGPKKIFSVEDTVKGMVIDMFRAMIEAMVKDRVKDIVKNICKDIFRK